MNHCKICNEETTNKNYCDDCRRARSNYTTTANNLKSKFNRPNKPQILIEYSITEFALWRKYQVKSCHYCGILESDLSKVKMVSQIKRTVVTMGVDRVNSDLGYSLNNIVMCCFVCNQIKGDRFSYDEMLLISEGLSLVWKSRLEQINLVRGK